MALRQLNPHVTEGVTRQPPNGGRVALRLTLCDLRIWSLRLLSQFDLQVSDVLVVEESHEAPQVQAIGHLLAIADNTVTFELVKFGGGCFARKASKISEVL